MIPANFLEMHAALKENLRRFPNCKIANCECDSKRDEWRAGCCCLCHLFVMDRLWGKDKWSLKDFMQQADKGFNEPSA